MNAFIADVPDRRPKVRPGDYIKRSGKIVVIKTDRHVKMSPNAREKVSSTMDVDFEKIVSLLRQECKEDEVEAILAGTAFIRRAGLMTDEPHLSTQSGMSA